ncbi:hypothetical protein [Robertkochia aurantiaca]|uniref:hypothetical protein n=1 Tax=Robertkochia aurantiaca TaxID=2873700 RepID=UPI001CCA6C1E|nr:hypothetical protein [Robertkochia sp. 3YJGBD-33]
MENEKKYLDRQVKRAFRNKEMSPGNMAWDRLEEMLDKDAEKPVKRLRDYRPVAAAVLLFLMAGSLFYYLSPVQQNQIEVTTTPAPGPGEDHPDQIEQQLIQPVTSNAVAVQDDSTDSKRAINHSDIADPGERQIVVTHVEKPADDPMEDSSDHAIAFQEDHEFSPAEAAEREVAVLLAEAQSKIYKDTLSADEDVDAMALLEEVEDELDETFKEKMFDMLKSGFKKVKTAVAERNQ